MVGNTPANDLFCSGHAFTGDGNLLTGGGTDRIKKWMYGEGSGPYGHDQSFVLRTDLGDPNGQGTALFWEQLPSVSDARWYPTLIPLDTGGVLSAGHTGVPSASSWSREELVTKSAGWLPSENNWRWANSDCHELLAQDDGLFMHDYPRMHLLSNSFVMFVDSETKELPHQHVSHFLPRNTFFPANCLQGTTPATRYQWEQSPVNPADVDHAAQAGGNSVHLIVREDDLLQARKEVIYAIAGTKHGEEDQACPCSSGPSDAVRRMVNPDPTKVWELSDPLDPLKPPPLNFGRVNSNAVILLDGSILVVGGADHDPLEDCEANPPGKGCAHIRHPELLRPPEVFEGVAAPQWKAMAKQTHKRQYHSVAGLLPDGRVVSAGGTWSGAGNDFDKAKRSVEVYRPPYMFRGPRPVIDGEFGAAVDWDSNLVVQVKLRGGGAVKRVALLRNAAVTHAFDANQRYIELEMPTDPIDLGDDTYQVSVRTPLDEFEAPPGWYMLTVVADMDTPGVIPNAKNIPSPAKWIKLQ